MHITVNLNPVTKKNHGQIIYTNGRPLMLPSKQFTQYQRDCAEFMPVIPTEIDFPVNVKCEFYMQTKRRVDMVNLQQAILDTLVHYRILSDDNANIVVSMDGSRVLYDKDNPRTEIEITRAEDEP